MRNEINLTDEQIEKAFEPDVCLSIDEVVFTRDTIQDFLDCQSSFVDKGRVETNDGRKLVINKFQVAKGQSRLDLVVVDFGSVRGCYI